MDSTTKLRKLVYLCSIENGQLKAASRRQISQDIARIKDTPDVRLTIEEWKQPKTIQQIRAFHGPIIEQIQSDSMATDGIWKSVDRIKSELKEQFLGKVKQYYSDGSPVMVTINHPERKGVTYQWHLEETPSLESLSIDDFSQFITDIIDFYWHEKGLSIEIDTEKAKSFQKR